jgi:hypothetical protein
VHGAYKPVSAKRKLIASPYGDIEYAEGGLVLG